MMKWSDIQTLVPAPGGKVDHKACLEAFPVLKRAQETAQDPAYHGEGDVWTHTCMVMECLVSSAGYAEARPDEREILFLAALLHDVAKYRTTVVDPVSGRIGQPGHSRKGAVEARIALWDADVPFDTREAVCRLIQAHQLPFFALEGSRSGKTPEYLVRKLSWELDIPLLAMLAEADMRGRICSDAQKVLDNIELFRELAREEGCYGKPRPFIDAHTRVSYFRGADVHPDYPLFQEAGSKVIVMCGLPASGKNTWVEKHHPDLPVVSFDDARIEMGLRHGQNEGAVAHHAVDKAKDLLRKKAPFVWNATHLSQQMRDKTLDLLYAYRAEVDIVYLESSREVLLGRNQRRDTSLTNKMLEAMTNRWEAPLPTEAHRVRYIMK